MGIGERTLICEGCEGGFHTSCLDIDEGVWRLTRILFLFLKGGKQVTATADDLRACLADDRIKGFDDSILIVELLDRSCK